MCSVHTTTNLIYVIIVSKHTNETIYIHLIHYTHIPLLLSRECQGEGTTGESEREGRRGKERSGKEGRGKEKRGKGGVRGGSEEGREGKREEWEGREGKEKRDTGGEKGGVGRNGGGREVKGRGREGEGVGAREQYSPSTSSKGISRLSLHRPERVRGQGSNTAAMYWYGYAVPTTVYTQLLDGLTLNSLLLSQQTQGHYPSTLWHASEQ